MIYYGHSNDMLDFRFGACRSDAISYHYSKKALSTGIAAALLLYKVTGSTETVTLLSSDKD